MSLTILAIGVFGMIPVYLSSLKTASIGANRARALALATRDVEAFRSVPYCEIGFATSQTGYTSTWTDPANNTSYSTVTVTDPNANISGPSGPNETVAGQTYSFARYVLWATGKTPTGATTTSTYPQAYKRTVVIVSWSDRGGSHSARQDSEIYPGGLGTYVAGNCGANGSPGTQTPPSPPTNFTATTAASPAGQNEIDLAWTKPSVGTFDKYIVALSTDNFDTSHIITNNLSAASTSYAASGLAPGTTYQFQVYAVQNSTGYQAASGQASASTQNGSPSVNCSVGLVTFSPTGADQAANAASLTVATVSVSAHTTGTCPYLQLAYTSVEGAATITTVALVQGSPGVWTASMNGTTNWSIGNHVIAVEDATGTPLVQGNFIVCSAGKATCP
ncbi:MAG: Fibronectin type domain [Acidimicrobiales bacterium]|nr:Fibronectin type domain [Acidimicrobiales bacterium]